MGRTQAPGTGGSLLTCSSRYLAPLQAWVLQGEQGGEGPKAGQLQKEPFRKK